MPIRIIYMLAVFLILALQACKNNPSPAEEIPQKKPKLSSAAKYNTQLGIAYLEQGNIPRAKKKLLIAAEQDPQSADVSAALGYFYERTKEFDTAKTYYLKALSLAPESGAQMNNYGAFLCGQGEYALAESWFLKAIHNKQYLNTAAAYENAGFCAEKAKDLAKAEKWLSKALDQDPSRKKALYKLLKLQRDQGKLQDSLASIEKYSELVITDKLLIKVAKSIARDAKKPELEAYYLQYFQKFDQYANNGGVNNEYNNIG